MQTFTEKKTANNSPWKTLKLPQEMMNPQAFATSKYILILGVWQWKTCYISSNDPSRIKWETFTELPFEICSGSSHIFAHIKLEGGKHKFISFYKENFKFEFDENYPKKYVKWHKLIWSGTETSLLH